MTLLLAAIICTTVLPMGAHTLECTAEYAHTLPSGEQYHSSITRGIVTHGAYVTECSGEGHPWRVTMRDNGIVVCREVQESIFSDGFEGGDTSAWSDTVVGLIFSDGMESGDTSAWSYATD